MINRQFVCLYGDDRSLLDRDMSSIAKPSEMHFSVIGITSGPRISITLICRTIIAGIIVVFLVKLDIILQAIHVLHVVLVAANVHHLPLVLLVILDIIYLLFHVFNVPMNVLLVLVLQIVIHVKEDIFYIQEIVFNVTIIVNQLLIIVNVQVVKMNII